MRPTNFGDWGSRQSILFVDDDPNVLFLLQKYFKKSSFWVETARNGKEGIDKTEQKFFDLVMTDICMPVMDGNSLARFLKETTPSTLVVGMSSDLTKLDGPFDGVVHKPFLRNFVVNVVRNLLKV